MRWRQVLIVYRKELLDMLRDRRTIFSMVIFPLVIFPLMSVGFNSLAEKSVKKVKQQVSLIMLLGEENAPALAKKLRETTGIEVVPASPDYARQITDKKVRAAVEFPAGFEAAIVAEAAEPPKVVIYHYEAELRSGSAARRIEEVLRGYRDEAVAARLASRGMSPAMLKPVEAKRQNVAAAEKVGGERLAAMVSYFLVIIILSGASHPALDLTAGEKERGTMETILASPVGRRELVTGKFLLVLTASAVTAVLSLFSFGVSMTLAPSYMQDMTRGYGFAVSAKSVFAVMLVILPLAVLFAAALMAIAIFAKNYKEAQSYLGPLMIAAIMPAVISMLPGVELGPKLALIPILNVGLVTRELLTGNYPWGMIAVVFISTCVYAAMALSAAITMFQKEEVLFRA